MTAAATQSLRPATVTRAMRTLWPAPVQLNTRVTDDGQVVITGPLTMRDAAAVQARILGDLTPGHVWERVHFDRLGNGSARARVTFAMTTGLPAEFETVGWPAEWAAEQADTQTVLARHRMVRALELITGHTAQPGQTMKHIELGTLGRFVRVEGSSAYVTFTGDSEPSLVHAADVVAISDAEVIRLAAERGEPFIFNAAEVTINERVQHRGRPATVKEVDVEANTISVDYGYERTPGCPGSAGSMILSSALRHGALQKIANPAFVEARAALNKAIAVFVAADATWRAAVRDGRTAEVQTSGSDPVMAMQTANVDRRRAELALDIAMGKIVAGTVRFEVTSCSDDDGETWEVIHWDRREAMDSETATAQALRIADDQKLTDSRGTMTPKPWRVQVWTDPLATDPDGEWTNLIDPCPAGTHDPGTLPVSGGQTRSDGSHTRFARCSGCMRAIKQIAPYRLDNQNPNPWVLDDEQLPDADPKVIYLPLECVKEEHHGMEIHDGFGTWFTLIDVGPIDHETGRCEVRVEGRPVTRIYSTTMIQLRPGPIKHDGVAVNEHGVSLATITGTLWFNATADETGDGRPVGAWVVANVGDNFEIPAGHVADAHKWAAYALGEAGHGIVIDWVTHRDQFGYLWTPTFAGGTDPDRPVPPASQDGTRDGTQDTTISVEEPAASADRPVLAPADRPVPFGYQIELWDDRTWRTVRTGTTPPAYRPVPKVLDAVAATILSNIVPLLGLGPQDALPPVRVATWHTRTGLAGLATRA